MRYGLGLQTTLARTASVAGIGVHSGSLAAVTIRPAQADTGIVFVAPGEWGGPVALPAEARQVASTRLATVLRAGDVCVATVEHLLAALRGLGIDNARIEVDGNEVPILDGSAAPFVHAIDEAGVTVLTAPRRELRVLRPVRVEAGDAYAELLPHECARYDVTIDFPDPAIGRQRFASDLSPGVFRRELAAARTFGDVAEIPRLRAAGLALGSSLANSIGLENGRVLNPEGLRWADEFVRHKTLDAVGDLSLAGPPLIGLFRSFKGGHGLNFAAVRALLADPANFALEPAEGAEPDRFARREPATGRLVAGALFAPDHG